MTSYLAEKLVTMVSMEDDRLNKVLGYQSDSIHNYLSELLTTGRVEIGWRESCGTTDKTMLVHRAWVKVVKALKKNGMKIEEQSVKHKNSWATKAGGFWQSVIYSLPKSQEG